MAAVRTTLRRARRADASDPVIGGRTYLSRRTLFRALFAGSSRRHPWRPAGDGAKLNLRPGETGPAEAKRERVSKATSRASEREGYAHGRHRTPSPVVFRCPGSSAPPLTVAGGLWE